MNARRVVLAVSLAALVAAGASAWIEVVLADIYQPHAPGVEMYLLPSSAQRSADWRDWHLCALLAFVVLAAIAAVATWSEIRPSRGLPLRRLTGACSVLALALGALALLTRPLVAWDQVALRAVTVGTNFSGYWSAAFDPDVRFVLINGSEVSQSEYAVAMVVHLVAPIVGALSLLVVIIGLLRGARVSAR